MKRWLHISIMVVLFIVSWRMIALDADFFSSMPDVSWNQKAMLVAQNKLVGVSPEQLNQELNGLIDDGLAYRVEKNISTQVSMNERNHYAKRNVRCARSDRRRKQSYSPSIVVVQQDNGRIRHDEQSAKNYVTCSQLVPAVMAIMQRLFAEQKMAHKDQIIRLDPEQLAELKQTLIASHETVLQHDDEDDDGLDHAAFLAKYKKKHPLLFAPEGQLIDRLPSQSQTNYPQSLQPLSPSQAPYQQPVPQQPVMYYQQPMQQNNAGQMAAAMQLQSSAMAMQMQASALMMQAQQQPQMMPMPVMQQQMSMPQPVPRMYERSTLSKQEKNSLLMNILQKMGQSKYEINRLLMVLDIEFSIIELLLAGSNGRGVEQKVWSRKNMLRENSDLVKQAYEIIIDLATTDDETDAQLYGFFVRKGKDQTGTTNNPPIGKKKFLIKMLNILERYYEMIENMQNVMN